MAANLKLKTLLAKNGTSEEEIKEYVSQANQLMEEHPEAGLTASDFIPKRVYEPKRGTTATELPDLSSLRDAETAYDTYDNSIRDKEELDAYWRRQERQKKQKQEAEAKKKAEEAQKALDDYLDSEAYRNRNAGKAKWEAAATGEDEKKQALEAERDYWNRQAQSLGDENTLSADLDEIAAMPLEDQRALEQYAVAQDVDYYESLNFAQNGYVAGRAERNAAALFEKYGEQRVKELAESWKRSRSEQEAADAATAAEQHAGEHPILSNAASIAANMAGGIGGVFDAFKNAGERTGRYTTLDPSGTSSVFSVYGSQVRSTTQSSIEEGVGGPAGKALGLGYSGIMSAADSIARTLVFGPTGGLAVAGAGAFSGAVQEASRNGAPPIQAAIMGVASGGIEILTEKVPLDEWLKTAKGGYQKLLPMMKNALKNAAIEATEEELSLLGNLIAEAVILQEHSASNVDLADRVANGQSVEEAKREQAQAFLQEVLDTAIISAGSGGITSASAGIYANANYNATRSRAFAKAKIDAAVPGAVPGTYRSRSAQIAAQESTQGREGKPDFLADFARQLAANAPKQEQVQTDPQMDMAMMETVAPGSTALGGAQPEMAEVTETEIEENIKNAAQMQPVAALKGNEFTKGDGLKQRIQDFFQSLGGKVSNSRLGDVLLTKKGVKDDFAHGMPDEKAAAFAAVPEVIQNGQVVNYQTNWKDRGYATATIAAPVTIGGDAYMMVVIAKRNNGENRFYLHDVYSESMTASSFDSANSAHGNDAVTKGDPFNQDPSAHATSGTPGGPTSTLSVINRILDVKRGLQKNAANTSGPEAAVSSNPASLVENQQNPVYNQNKRSPQVQSVIDRLNAGGEAAPGIEEILSIPEIAQAERENEGPETITLPNRERIQEEGYRKAMKKGSWAGKENGGYTGPVKQERRMDIVIGLPGSGKSSVYTERLSREHQSRVIDTDDFREYIPEYNGSNAAIVHEEASSIRKLALVSSLDAGDNILLSTIGADAVKLEGQIEKYRKLGYSVHLHLNELPNNKSMARAIGRYLLEDGTTGRYVSPKLIAKYGNKPTETYLYLTGEGAVNNEGLDGNLSGSGRESGERFASSLAGIGSQERDGKTGEQFRELTGKGAVQNGELGGDLRAGRGQNPSNAGRTDSGNGSRESLPAGKGAAQNEGLDTDLSGGRRESRGRTDGNAGAQSSAAEGQTGSGGSLLAGYDWYSNDVERGQPPRLIQTSEARQADSQADTARVSAMVSGGKKTSRVLSNTFMGSADPSMRAVAGEIQRTNPELGEYDSQTEAGQNAEANARTDTPKKIIQQRDYLIQKEHWTASDIKTAKRVIDSLQAQNDAQGIMDVFAKLRAQATNAGQVSQALAEYTRTSTGTGAAISAMDYVRKLGEENISKKFYAKQGFGAWSKALDDTIVTIANDIDSVQDGDVGAMRQIIRDMANFRRTTENSGTGTQIRKNAEKSLMSLDYKTARQVALSQLSMIPNDFRKRSFREKAHTIRIMNMLASVKTTSRNLQGNAVQGLADSLSDSSFGQLADMVMSRITGVRTVGSDIAHAREYTAAAQKAWDFAALCIELDIPMENQAAYDIGIPREGASGGSSNTFSMQGNKLERFFAGYSRMMKYALEATDSVFSEGTAGATAASLKALGEKSGLTDADVSALSEYAGQRRTFKEDRKLTKSAKGIKKAIGIAGDSMMPFVEVPTNTIHTGMDYVFGIAEGVGEMISVCKDARKLDTMTEQQRADFVRRQRKAASDFGRGVTGFTAIAIGAACAAAGCFRYTNPEDRDQENSFLNRYLSGAQINWSAFHRLLTGNGTSEEQEGDLVSGLDSLGQYGVLFAISAILADGDKTLGEKAKDSVTAVINTILEMPSLQGIQDLVDLAEGIADGDYTEAAGTFIGDMASGIVPAVTRNAAQAVDPVIRDTSAGDPITAAKNRFVAGIPFASKTLPAKYDPLTGKEQVRDASAGEAVFNRIFAPDAWHRIGGDEVSRMLDDIYGESGDASIYPATQAPASYTAGGEKIPIEGKADTQLYQRTYSEAVSSAYRELVDDAEFLDLSTESKVKKLKDIQADAAARAAAALTDYSAFRDSTKEEIFRLAQETGDSSLYFSVPKRAIQYTDINGNSVDREMTNKEYQVYKETVVTVEAKTLDGLTSSVNYKSLPDSMKAEAVKLAKQYAAEQARAAAIGDYHSNADKWIKEAGSSPSGDILIKVRSDTLNAAITATVDSLKNGFDSTDESKTIEVSYRSYQRAPAYIQEEIKEDASGTMKYYIEARESGVSHGDFMKALSAVSTVTGTGSQNKETGKPTVTAYDRYGAIADAVKDEKTAVAIIKAYMPDYDPAAETKDYSELKLDSILDMGFSVSEYDDLYRLQSSETKWKPAAKLIQQMYPGLSYTEAYEIVKIFKDYTASSHAKAAG